MHRTHRPHLTGIKKAAGRVFAQATYESASLIRSQANARQPLFAVDSSSPLCTCIFSLVEPYFCLYAQNSSSPICICAFSQVEPHFCLHAQNSSSPFNRYQDKDCSFVTRVSFSRAVHPKRTWGARSAYSSRRMCRLGKRNIVTSECTAVFIRRRLIVPVVQFV